MHRPNQSPTTTSGAFANKRVAAMHANESLTPVRIALIGDYDPDSVPHQAIPRAIELAGGSACRCDWVHSTRLQNPAAVLGDYSGCLVHSWQPIREHARGIGRHSLRAHRGCAVPRNMCRLSACAYRVCGSRVGSAQRCARADHRAAGMRARSRSSRYSSAAGLATRQHLRLRRGDRGLPLQLRLERGAELAPHTG